MKKKYLNIFEEEDEMEELLEMGASMAIEEEMVNKREFLDELTEKLKLRLRE